MITSADGRGVNVCVSEPLSGPCLFSASVSAGVSHAVSETSINIPNRSARSLPADKAAQQPLRWTAGSPSVSDNGRLIANTLKCFISPSLFLLLISNLRSPPPPLPTTHTIQHHPIVSRWSFSSLSSSSFFFPQRAKSSVAKSKAAP